MKISIITAVFNRVATVAEAVRSVQAQTWQNIEHVAVDGGSTDGTLDVLKACLNEGDVLISEVDNGIYDALNKGIALSTGDVIGLMHSDDFFADNEVLACIAAAFADPSVDAVYGDLDYVDKDDVRRVVRRWRSGEYSVTKFSYGWMPPHPTLFLRRSVLERWGGFDTIFKISADYDAILRYFIQGKIQAIYIPHVLVKMRLGGKSNKSISNIYIKTREDYFAMRRNNVGGIGTLVLKNIRKVNQFFWVAK